MPPWLLWVPLLAIVNLLVFLAIRGRWGRLAWLLAVASFIGVVLGDMHVLAASVLAQLLMLAVSLLSALGPVRVEG